MQKAESEELEVQKPQVKLRRTVSEVARPASTPPIMASAIKDEDDEDRIIAELEVGQGYTWPPSHPSGPVPFPAKPIQGEVTGLGQVHGLLGSLLSAGLFRTPSFLLRFLLHCEMGERGLKFLLACLSFLIVLS